MATRKIKNAKDITTDELIYFKGHAQATFMSDGRTVEDAINGISGESGGSIDTSNLATKEELAQKQDIISDIDTIRSGAAKGATALQSYTEQYKGTVTGVKINGTTKSPSNGVVDLGSVITSHQTLKTINGESIVGSGNITISGGSSNSAYSEVSHGTSDTTFTLTPNVFHIWDEVTELTLTLDSETSGVANEYLFQFTSGSEPTALTLPDDIKWANDEAPVIEANKIYQISVLKGLGSVLEFTIPAVLINFTINGAEYHADEGMTWHKWCDSAYNTSSWYVSDSIIREVGDVSGYYMIDNITFSDIIINNTEYSVTYVSTGPA